MLTSSLIRNKFQSLHRYSKRLAGIQLDPVAELVTRSRARRGAAKSKNAANMSQSTKFSTPESSSQPRIEWSKH
ncbi:hypothetical protein HN51_000327 [Arachis hypogaea]